jgi:hypothetical protein
MSNQPPSLRVTGVELKPSGLSGLAPQNYLLELAALLDAPSKLARKNFLTALGAQVKSWNQRLDRERPVFILRGENDFYYSPVRVKFEVIVGSLGVEAEDLGNILANMLGEAGGRGRLLKILDAEALVQAWVRFQGANVPFNQFASPKLVWHSPSYYDYFCQNYLVLLARARELWADRLDHYLALDEAAGFTNSALVQELHLELPPLGYGLIVEAIEHYHRRPGRPHQFEINATSLFKPLDYQEVFGALAARHWVEAGSCEVAIAGSPALKLALIPGPKLRKISRSDLLSLVSLV